MEISKNFLGKERKRKSFDAIRPFNKQLSGLCDTRTSRDRRMRISNLQVTVIIK